MFRLFEIILYSLIIVCSFQYCQAQNKHALLVGISEYPSDTGWRNIHGSNDVDLLKHVLKDFKITELKEDRASYDNITRALNTLSKSLRKGDIVYIHLSGHGQPYEDLDGDEIDGWDESFIPYDAHLYYEENVYSGENHLTDDRLNIYLQKIRSSLGDNGILYVAIDACHAGNSYRNTDTAVYRGTSKGFSLNNKQYIVSKANKTNYLLRSQNGYAPIIMIEACQSTQVNTEVCINGNYYGPLSYAIYSTLQENTITKQTTWINKLPDSMRKILPSWNRQKMVIESSIPLNIL